MSARKKRQEEAPVPPVTPPAAGSEQLLVGDGSGEQSPLLDDPVQEHLAPPVLIEVKLLKPHTHADQDHPIGATLKVSLDTEAWLKKHGVI